MENKEIPTYVEGIVQTHDLEAEKSETLLRITAAALSMVFALATAGLAAAIVFRPLDGDTWLIVAFGVWATFCMVDRVGD